MQRANLFKLNKLVAGLAIFFLLIVVGITVWQERQNKLADQKILAENSHLRIEKADYQVTLLTDKILIPKQSFEILDEELASPNFESFVLKSKQNHKVTIDFSIATKESTPWFSSIREIGFETNFDNSQEQIVDWLGLVEESMQISDNNRIIVYKGDTGTNFLKVFYEKNSKLDERDLDYFEAFLTAIKLENESQ